MLKFLFTIVVALTGIALANLNGYSPIINDSGFSYYRPSGSNASTTISYWTVGVEGGELVVRIAHEATPGALTHRFGAIERLPSEKMAQLSGSRPSAAAPGTLLERDVELARLRSLAGMSPLNSGWSVVHPSISLDAAVAAYSNWFLGNGLSLAADPANTIDNVRPFTVSGLADDLRVVFTAQGAGVRVYIGKN